MKNLRYFNNYSEYYTEKDYLHLPSVSYIKEGSILKYKYIPKDIRKSLVAWYSPRKQKLTNDDVVENYLIDVPNGGINTENGSASFNGHDINITNSLVKNHDIVSYLISSSGILTLYITGQTEDKVLRLAQQTSNGYKFIDLSNGINEINLNYISWIAFEAKFTGECNINIRVLPTSVLYDFSGRKNHSYIYGCRGKLNSGVGIYNIDFTNVSNNQAFDDIEFHYNKIVLKGMYKGNYNTFGQYTVVGVQDKVTRIKVTGINKVAEAGDFLTLQYGYTVPDGGKNITKEINIKKDGVYQYDFKELVIPEGTQVNDAFYNRLYFGTRQFNCDGITIEEIPSYPNQLCYDGLMYAVGYKFPVFTDYTVMADRIWFKDKVKTWSYFIDKKRAFDFEKTSDGETYSVMSFSANQSITLHNDGISYQTRELYNGQHIEHHSDQPDNSTTMYIGTTKDSIGNQGFIGCHGDILVFSRSLTEAEINYIKNIMKEDKFPTPIFDFDMSSIQEGNDTILDGHGCTLSLKNFNWTLMSGKGGYNVDLSTFIIDPGANILQKSHKVISLRNAGENKANIYMSHHDDSFTGQITVPPYKIRISGLGNDTSKGAVFNYFYGDDFGYTKNIELHDGVIQIPEIKINKVTPNLGYRTIFQFILKNVEEDLDITIEQLPLYPNSLVFDGIDDYGEITGFNKDKTPIKSLIVDCIPFQLDRMIYDQRLGYGNHSFAIYMDGESIAYNFRNNGLTYIDGSINNSIKVKDLLKLRQNISIVNKSATGSIISDSPKVGCNFEKNSNFSKMAVYRITGFTEELTSEQIKDWYIMNKP